ncbi:carbohydrate ABC transporter permease [Oribacterium sp. HCP3S3_B9]|uniref:carbohydrate ABC transporter permease n=1 Tax=unclassified Oribacterium TaxID=2629782 RepID=UPI003F8B389A
MKCESMSIRILRTVLLALMLLFLLFPFYWTFLTSIKPENELYGKVVTYWTVHPTFEAYKKLFTSTVDFLSAMKNSLLVAACTTLLTLVVATMAAYAFSRYDFVGRKVLMSIFLCNNMFPTVLLLIPLYSIMRKLQLLFTPVSLILSYTTFTIPFSVWLLIGFINDLPASLEEAAMVDGCNRGQAFMKIIFPLLRPSIIATGVYIFMQSWNEYTFAMMFTNTSSRTIPVALKSLIGQLGVQWDLLTAGGILTIIPVCIMFFFAQKRLVEGLTAGAVKG